MKDSILKTKNADLKKWVEDRNLGWEEFKDNFPHDILIDDGPTYWEFSVSSSGYWVSPAGWEGLNSDFEYYYLSFNSKESKEQFLENNPTFPVYKRFYEEHPLSLMIWCEKISRLLGYNNSYSRPEIISLLEDYFHPGIKITVPVNGRFRKNWDVNAICRSGYFRVDFKTKDDFMMWKLSNRHDVVVS